MNDDNGGQEIKAPSGQDGPDRAPAHVGGAPNANDTQKVSDEKVDQDIKTLESSIDKDVKGSESLMTKLTGALVLVGLLQFGAAFLQWKTMDKQLGEMKSGGIDTHALANAASDQADAAQQFSDTAEDINGRMQDAVDQLEASANNAKASIHATQDALRLEQRAWVSASNFQTVEGSEVTGSETNPGNFSYKNILFEVRNTGTERVNDFETGVVRV
jgi:hypothetical protein